MSAPAGSGNVGASARLQRAILDLLADRRGTICPSEAARRVGGEDWRGLMDATRLVGVELAERGLIEVRQRGEIVDPRRARGPVRYALVRSNASNRQP